MSIIKADFGSVIQLIEKLRDGEPVKWEKFSSSIGDDMQESYDEILNKIEEIKERVTENIEDEDCTDLEREMGFNAIIGELKSWTD